MFGTVLKLFGTVLSCLIFLPPLFGAAYGVLTAQPMPAFFPKDVLSKATYGATWGFWSVWQWIRPVAGLTGGAQVAVAKLTDGTIGVPLSEEDLNASSTWYSQLNGMALTVQDQATSYYANYASSVSVDLNQSWHVTLWIVSNDGSAWLTRLDAVWYPENSTLPPAVAYMSVKAYSPLDTLPDVQINPHYGVVVTLDTIKLTELMLSGTQIDWGKFSMNLLQTFYKGNIQVWTISS
jgi:hypothetical protein